MPGPIAAATAPTSSTPRSTIPAARPRQPQWSIPTPRSPASATGRQSATWTKGVSRGLAVTWPSPSSGAAEAPSSAVNGFGAGARSRRATSAPWT